MAIGAGTHRELGLLRVLGMTQAGLSGLLLVETGLTALIAGLISVIVAQGTALAVGAALLAGIYPPAGPRVARRRGRHRRPGAFHGLGPELDRSGREHE